MANPDTRKVWRMRGPGGIVMETTAATRGKAVTCLKWRLEHELHMRHWDAQNYDCSDLKPVSS